MAMLRAAIIYTALAVSANAAAASPALDALREGDMKKLVFHAEPKAVADVAFVDEAGGELMLADFRGQYVLLNFWATWCAPCRKEMPSLNVLQTELGSENFRVVTIATGRNPPAAIQKFFDEVGVTELPHYRDPEQNLARHMAVLGLPISVILNPEGREIARLRGDADWASESAKAIFKALTQSSG